MNNQYEWYSKYRPLFYRLAVYNTTLNVCEKVWPAAEGHGNAVRVLQSTKRKPWPDVTRMDASWVLHGRGARHTGPPVHVFGGKGGKRLDAVCCGGMPTGGGSVGTVCITASLLATFLHSCSHAAPPTADLKTVLYSPWPPNYDKVSHLTVCTALCRCAETSTAGPRLQSPTQHA